MPSGKPDESQTEPDIEGAIRLLHESTDSQIRQFVAYLLGQTGDARAIEPLIDALGDDHVGVRGAAANALGTIGDPGAIPYLRPLLKESHPQLVIWAAFALTRLGDDQFDVLAHALASGEVEVRRSAVLALRQLGDARAIGPLLALLGDDSRRFAADSTVDEAVNQALVSLGYNVGRLPPRA
ncbi:MAG: HEAT repeat domain-containing protein [Anaerolineae bacterium]|nr:HEAT repeat domain-containing protein [Anaerolineae bacterium]